LKKTGKNRVNQRILSIYFLKKSHIFREKEAGSGMVKAIKLDDYSASAIFEKSIWLNTVDAAIYLRKLTKDGLPSVGAIRTAVCRGVLRSYKWQRRLYFKKTDIDHMLEAGRKKGSA
jgi:hypothetical protein